MRLLATGAAIGILGLLLAEALLRLLALAAPAVIERRAEPLAGQSFRILCLGDSHTYGWGVARTQAWPAQLELALNAASPEVRVEVFNLGIPGSNSAQLLAALPANLARYAPDLVIVETGGNDLVNHAGLANTPETELPERIHRTAWDVSRLYRLLVLVVHDRRLRAVPRADHAPHVHWKNALDAVEVRHPTSSERFEHQMIGALLDPSEHARVTHRNLEAIVRLTREAGVPIVLASYVHSMGPHGVANAAMRGIEDALFVAQIYPDDLAAQLPPLSEAERAAGLFLPDLHPRPPIYVAFAAHLRDALLAAQLVPVASAPAPAAP